MLKFSLLTCVLCLVVGALSHRAPYWNEAYIEAVPNQDFTPQNLSMAAGGMFATAMGYDVR